MSYTEKEKTWEKQKEYIYKIIKRNKNKKGIIHAGNYEIAKWVEKEFSNDKRFIFHTPDTRTEALNNHIISDKPTILVSPSMMNGVDLKDDLSRFQIILKIPYPNMKSNKIKKRMSDYKKWYNWKTVCDFIQAYGRSIRSIDDHAETYVLDESFSDLLKYNYDIIPKYITDAIKTLK